MIPSFLSVLTLVTLVAAQATDTPDVLQVGQVIELRGALDPEARFVAEKGELQKASADDVLIGTVAASERDADSFELLGQLVVTDADTKWDGLTQGSQAGKRVKVEGTWKGPRKFVAKGVYARGAGRDRVGGRVDELKKVEGGWEARVMIFTVLMKDDMPIEHAQPVCAGEVRGRGNVPLFFVAVLRNQLVEASRARFGIGKLRPTGIRLPKSADSFFEFGIRLGH